MNRALLAGLSAWTLATFLARGVLGDLFAPFGIRPDLLVVLVVYWALALGAVPGTISGFVVGLVADAELGRGLGPQAGVYALAGYLIGRAGRGLVRDNFLPQALLLFLTALLAGMVRTFQSGGEGDVLFGIALLRLLAQALYTALVGPVLYWLLRRFGVPDPMVRSGHDD